LKQLEKSEMMKIEKTMYSLLQYFRIAISIAILFLRYFGNLKNKKLYEQFMNKLLVTFYTFGTNFCFLRGEEMDGGGGFEAKIRLFYSVTAVIIPMYIRQMCVNETDVCVIVCACLCA